MTHAGFGLVLSFHERDGMKKYVLESVIPGSPAERMTQKLQPGDELAGLLGRRVDVLLMHQLKNLMANLPKDHPISMQFLRKGEKIEVTIDGREWEAVSRMYEEEQYLSEDDGQHFLGQEEESQHENEVHDQNLEMELQRKVQELEKELALRDDEHDLLERKATILEQQVLQAVQTNHTDSTNDNLVAKLTRKYERMLHKKDRQIEIGKRFEKDNETLRIANAELKALTEMQERLNIGLQRQLQQVQEQHQQYKEQNMMLQAGASSSHRSWEQDVRQQRQLAYEVQDKLNAVTRERDDLYSKLQASHHQREIVWKEVHDQRSQINELLSEISNLQTLLGIPIPVTLGAHTHTLSAHDDGLARGKGSSQDTGFKRMGGEVLPATPSRAATCIRDASGGAVSQDHQR